ncbi:MAG: NADH:flavin oxidoreductase [Pseudomonadales bacterium]|nr:NADH:flavin oxidoreductase [Pseudomonadales bacterium]
MPSDQQETAITTDLLFQPFESEKLELKNRVIMAPMTRNFSPNSIPGDDVAAYYARRAQNDVGLIITEGTTVNQVSATGYPGVPAFHGDALAGWKKVVDAVHAAGGKIAPQLWHVGTVRKPGTGPDPEAPGIGPSGISSKGKRKAKVMSDSEIADTIEAFAQGALDAKNIGFDAVEFHGAHGYLIDQFFWDVTNERDDRYGGSLEKRCQFAIEILQEARKKVGDEFPFILRFSQWKQQDYTAKLAQTPEELERFLIPLSEAGVDIFHASTRRFWEPEFEGSDLNLAGWTRKITGKPAITVGSVGLSSDFIESNFLDQEGNDVALRRLDDLLQRMADDEFDLVAVGRALLQDPEWLIKVKNEQWQDIQEYNRVSIKTLY